MILSSTQAEATANAMAHLNNVAGQLMVRIGEIEIDALYDSVRVSRMDKPGGLLRVETEVYTSQADFCTTYGLQ